MRRSYLLACSVVIPLAAHEVEIQSGSLKGGIAPTADFAALSYRYDAYRAGVFTAPGTQGVLTSYSSLGKNFTIELGQREKSFEQGFFIGNGAYLPWTRNFAFAEPLGARAGIQNELFAFDTMYYQQANQAAALSQVSLTPARWFRLAAGAGSAMGEAAFAPVPLASLNLGAAEGKGLGGGVQYAGHENTLVHARYGGDFTLRGFAFYRSEAGALASGIYDGRAGGAGQLLSQAWFAQIFITDKRYGMIRYGGDLLTAITLYEGESPMAGISLRNSATGFHVRSGVTFAADGSLQTLVGGGYANYLFLGGGHYQLQTDEPLEPIIFPADWYSSVLLQSASMRIQDRGFKMLALVDTEVVRGFFAVTYSESGNRREQFGFFLRVSGGLVF